MAIDPSRIKLRKDFRYTAGEVLFSVRIFKTVRVSVRSDDAIVITPRTRRPALVKHAAILMRRALGVRTGFTIDVRNQKEIKHCGLGSSSGLIASVAVAIHELYGNPIPPNDLIRYVAQNHGEEIDGSSDFLHHVQSIGGSAAAGLVRAGMIVLTGEAVPIALMRVAPGYTAVIGIPKDFVEEDSKRLMDKERAAMKHFIATGKKHGAENAYNVLHIMIPAMAEGDMSRIGDVIYEYRYTMGSIQNCSFAYPKLWALATRLAPLKRRGIAPVLTVSSVGPGFFAITKQPDACARAFAKAGLRVHRAAIQNDGYEVIRRTKK